MLKLFADSVGTFERLIAAVEVCALDSGLPRVAIRCQVSSPWAYASLVRCGYRVRWTDLRMTLTGYPEASVGEDEVLLSNWEI